MVKICLQNIPVYKSENLEGGGLLIFFLKAVTKIMFDLKRQETGNNQLSQIFLKNV